jgi:GBP family porin
MKKSLIALAALSAFATAAQAQSSNVSIYGIVDTGFVSASGQANGRVAGLSSGNLSTSRLGFRGTEDLGGGLKANFNFEGGINVDTGSSASGTNLFDRASWVGLDKTGVGTVLLGRSTRLDFDAAAANDAFGASGFGSAGQTMAYNLIADRTVNSGADIAAHNGTPAANSLSVNRYVNSVKATTASFGGFAVAYQHAFGEVAGANSASRSQAYSINYTAGKANASYAYSRQNNTAGAKSTETSVASASYDFGVAKAFVGYGEGEKAGNTSKTKTTWVGISAPVSAKVSVMAQYYDIANQGFVAGSNANKDATAFNLGATYAFSKRTTAYVMGGKVNNDAGATVSMTSTASAAGKDQTAYTAGVRHSF